MSVARRPGWLAAVLVLAVAAAWRLHGVGDWSLDGDEVYSWYDVQEMRAGEPWSHGAVTHPLGYLFILAAVAVAGLSEAVVRAPSVITGVLAVWALLRMRRDVIDAPAAVVAGALAAISPWLIYHAQTARFYAPLLLFAALATLWTLPGPGRRPAAAALAWALAVLCHPTALLLGPGLLVPVLWPVPRWRTILAVLGVAVVGAAVAWFATGGVFEDVADRVLEGVDPGHYDPLHFVQGLGYNVGPAVGLLALLGVPAAWARRREAGAAVLACAALPPIVLLAGALGGLSMHQRYAMCAVPATLVLAGWGWASVRARRPALAVGLALLALAVPSPRLLAHARDGNRHDLRAVADFLTREAEPDDLFAVDEHATLEVYLHRAARFADTSTEEAPLPERKRHDWLRNRQDVWAAVKLSRLGSGYGDEFTQWLDEYFTEITRVGVAPPPMVRHDNRYVIYRRTARIPPERGPSPSGTAPR